MIQPINIIFPMAGAGSRFGGTFKPFLKAADETFIERASQPFKNLDKSLYDITFIFIFTFTQEAQYSVSKTLAKIFINYKYKNSIINNTDGPLQTVQSCIQQLQLSGLSFICDCDHSIDIKPIIEKSIKTNFEVIIPVWTISKEDFSSWGKVKINSNNKILDFCEKELLDYNEDEDIKGIIGCYLVNDIANFIKYPSYTDISSILKDMLLEQKNLITVNITYAEFFGTPKQLEKFRFIRASTYSLFIDIDGTLVNQDTKELLPDTITKLTKWREQGHRIILTTASPENITKKILELYNIPYDHIICNLSSGPRIIINDKKPYLPFYTMADGITIERNKGIHEISLSKYIPPTIIKLLQGGSFANTYLVNKDIHEFVRKYIHKNSDNKKHVEVLKQQCENLRKWKYLSPNLVPIIIDSKDSTNEFYYDMEYYKDYDHLSLFDYEIINTVLYKLITVLHNDIYVFKRPIEDPTKWVNVYLNTFVYPRLKQYNTLGTKIKNLIHHNGIIINGYTYPSIYTMLQNISYNNIAPKYEGIIHGDLTLENILYNKDLDDFKVIDLSSSRYVDAFEIDIARLFQSIICDYASWDKYINDINIIDNIYTLPNKFIEILENKKKVYSWLILYCSNNQNIDTIYTKGIYYMSTYLIRMVPYLIKKSENLAILSLLLAHIHLNSVYILFKDNI